jgi:HK97 family phage portal protein
LNSLLGGEYSNQPTSADYMDSYESSFLVFACVRKIAEKVANTNFRLYKASKKINEVNDHPILDLLSNPNGRMTGFELLDTIQTGLELTGNAYLLKVRGNSGKVLELWPLRPDWVEIVSQDNMVVSYKYTNGGTITKYDPDDIIHIKNTNPKSSIYGLPVIKPALEIIKNLVFANRWNMNFFYNSARPDFMLISKMQLSEDQKNEFRKKWDSKFKGVSRSNNYALLEGDMDVKPMNFTMRDMEFSTLSEGMINQTLSAFGVPKSIIGMQGMNRAEAEAQIYVFLSETIEPKVKRIVDSFNQFLVFEFGDNLYLDYDDPSPENRKDLIEEYSSALQNNWMLINEVRDLEGMPPVEGGWSFYLPLSSVPSGGLSKVGGISPKKYYQEKEKREQKILERKVLSGKRSYKLKEKLKNDLVKYIVSKRQKIKKKLSFNDEQKTAYWKQHDKRLDSDIKIFRILSEKLFKGQRERVLKALDENFKNFTKDKFDLIDWKAEKDIFADSSKPVYTDIIKRRGGQTAVLLGTNFDMTDKIRKFIDKKRFFFADEVNKTTQDKIRKQLKEGLANEESVSELAERIDEVYDSREGPGSEAIARTEVIGATGGADLEAFSQSGVVEKKEWLATPDDRTRESHLATNGEQVNINERFSNGLLYPGDSSAGADEVVNCRCVLLPVIE